MEGTNDGKKVRIQVRTVKSMYVGDLVMPAVRSGLSDVLNETPHAFIDLTDVVINDKDRAHHVSLNKSLIESITQL